MTNDADPARDLLMRVDLSGLAAGDGLVKRSVYRPRHFPYDDRGFV